MARLVHEGAVVAAGDGAGEIDIRGGAGDVEIFHHQEERRPHPQHGGHVAEVRLQVRVAGQRDLLLQPPVAPTNLKPKEVAHTGVSMPLAGFLEHFPILDSPTCRRSLHQLINSDAKI